MIEKTKSERTKEQRVTLRIWKGTEDMIGHVSLQTYSNEGKTGNGNYISFWPSKAAPDNRDGVKGLLHQTLNVDKKNEGQDGVVKKHGGEPDLEIHLYGLNIKIINDEFEIFKKSLGNYNWSVYGSSTWPIRPDNTRNCSGLVSHLLYKGGLLQGGIQTKNTTYSNSFRNYAVAIALVAFMVNLQFDCSSFFKFLLFGAVIGGALGGMVDAYNDTHRINETLNYVIKHVKSGRNTSIYAFKLLVYPTNFVIGTVASGVTLGNMFGIFSNSTRYLLTTPNHIADLAENCVTNQKEDVSYPRINNNKKS